VQPITRRGFFGLAAGAAAFAACSRSGPGATPTATPLNHSLVLATVEIAVGDERVAFAVFDGQRPIVPGDVRFMLTPPAGEPVEVEPRRVEIERGLGGEEAGGDSYELLVVNNEFQTPGHWFAEARFQHGGRERTVSSVLEVKGDSTTPRVGEPALRTESPTTSDPRGVDPICTRKPVCSMHDMTIAQAVGSGKPSVLAFATPRFCASQTCGPAVDIIESGKQLVGDAASFVHIEIYPSLDIQPGRSPTTEAVREWGLPGEPWVVFVDAQGVVRARWSGAVGEDEFHDGVQALVAGTL